ncbi:MAG: hypothetical protein ACJAS4_001471 [Bacteriovoracaceae bacterium]|jgi:hypothetical protein
MKNLLIGLVLLSSASSFAYDCEAELSDNTASTQEIVQMTEVTETQRSFLLGVSSNARESIELACGLRVAKEVDPLVEVENARQQILEMEGISDAQRSLLLEMNLNTKNIVELSL